jgi:hypothetical protein
MWWRLLFVLGRLPPLLIGPVTDCVARNIMAGLDKVDPAITMFPDGPTRAPSSLRLMKAKGLPALSTNAIAPTE